MESIARSYHNYNLHVIKSTTRKRKMVCADKCPIGLRLNIRHAKVNNPSVQSYVSRSSYSVVYWVNLGEEYQTEEVEAFFYPNWNEEETILLENSPDDYAFLNMEIVKLNSKDDPGTSTGNVIVGRAKIPLPRQLHCEELGCFELVRNEGIANKLEGYIVLSMELIDCLEYD